MFPPLHPNTHLLLHLIVSQHRWHKAVIIHSASVSVQGAVRHKVCHCRHPRTPPICCDGTDLSMYASTWALQASICTCRGMHPPVRHQKVELRCPWVQLLSLRDTSLKLDGRAGLDMVLHCQLYAGSSQLSTGLIFIVTHSLNKGGPFCSAAC